MVLHGFDDTALEQELYKRQQLHTGGKGRSLQFEWKVRCIDRERQSHMRRQGKPGPGVFQRSTRTNTSQKEDDAWVKKKSNHRRKGFVVV